jgi:uncharacterized metal-binding protein YceD (DUF177 family)
VLLDAQQRGLTVTEVLELHHLPDDGLKFDESLDPTWVDGQLGIDKGPTSFHCQPGPNVRLEVQPMGSMTSSPPILIRGKANAELKSTCVRCLTEVRVRLSVQIEQLLFPESAQAESEEEAAASGEVDEGVYSRDGVDLPNVLREAMLLELAMNPTCEDEASCDVRTQALIDEVNAKHSPSLDPRWAALQELLKKAPS